MNFPYFDTWLGFLGCVCGLVAAAVWNWSPLRAGVAGFAAGIAIVVLLNVMGPPVPCLQSAKGWDIWRAYLMCS